MRVTLQSTTDIIGRCILMNHIPVEGEMVHDDGEEIIVNSIAAIYKTEYSDSVEVWADLTITRKPITYSIYSYEHGYITELESFPMQGQIICVPEGTFCIEGISDVKWEEYSGSMAAIIYVQKKCLSH